MSEIIRNLFIIDKCSHKDMENLLVKRQLIAKEITDGSEKRILELHPASLYEGEKLKEPYKSAILLKTLGHKTATLLSILSFLQEKKGSYLEEISDFIAEGMKESQVSDSRVKSGTKSYLGSLLKVLCEVGLLHEGRGEEKGKGGKLRKYYYLESGIHMEDFASLFLGKSHEFLKPSTLKDYLKIQYDEKCGELVAIHTPEKYTRKNFRMGVIIESLVKSGIVNTEKAGKQYLSFYDVLDVAEGVKNRIVTECEGKPIKAIHSEKLTQYILQELDSRNPTGILSKKYENYIKFRINKKIVDGEEETIDFGSIRKILLELASQKGITLEGELLSHMTEQVVEVIKSVPLVKIKKNLLQDLCDSMISEKIVLLSEEEMKKRLEAAENLLETSRLYVKLDPYQARTLLSTVKENCLIAIAMKYKENPPKNPILLRKLIRTHIGSLTRDFSEAKRRGAFELDELLSKMGKGFSISSFLGGVLEEKEEPPLEETEMLVAITKVLLSQNSSQERPILP